MSLDTAAENQVIALWHYLSLFLGPVVWFLPATVVVGSIATWSNFVIEDFAVVPFLW